MDGQCGSAPLSNNLKSKPKNPYDFSKPFDTHTWSDFPEVKRAIDDVLAVIAAHVPQSIKPEKLRRCVTVVTLDVYVASLIHPELYVGFSRDSGAYNARSRYNALHIGRTVIKIIDAMFAAGLIEGKRKGINFPNYKRNGRMRATPALLTIIEAAQVKPTMIGKPADLECIELRDKRGEDGTQTEIDYDDTPETEAMRASLRAYNELIARTDITLDPTAYEEYRASERYRYRFIDFTRKFTKRIFSNGNFSEGGRFYGGWWESCPSELREFILINGNRTQELDLGNVHISIIYALGGINYAWDIGGDAYKLPGYEHLSPHDRKMLRECVKQVQLIAINAKRDEAVGAIRSALLEDRAKWEWFKASGLSIRTLIEALLAKHPRIAEYFFTGVGIKLQNWDAQVAQRVMDHFTAQGVPVLAIHDSFVIEDRRWHELSKVMREAVDDVIGQKLLGTDDAMAIRIKAKGGGHEELLNMILQLGEGGGPEGDDHNFDDCDYPCPDN